MASTADGFFLSAYTDCNDNELLRRMRTGDEESKETPFAFRPPAGRNRWPRRTLSIPFVASTSGERYNQGER